MTTAHDLPTGANLPAHLGVAATGKGAGQG
ncbi:hypothetical protein VTO73DRAFT_8665 [Trametes versicolor]